MTDERQIAGGVVHALPDDLKEALKLQPEALATWDDITALARNEWICWIESAKKLGLRKPDGGQAPAVLLARLRPSRKGTLKQGLFPSTITALKRMHEPFRPSRPASSRTAPLQL